MKIKSFICATLVLLFCNYLSAQKLRAIKAGKLIDVVNGTVLLNQIILIDSHCTININPND